jgi:hypothetical protein
MKRLTNDGKGGTTEGQLHGIWWQPQRGNMAEVFAYIQGCCKDGQLKTWIDGTTPYEWGTRPTEEAYAAQAPHQGKRKDLDSLRDLIRDENPTDRDLFDGECHAAAARYDKHVQKLRRVYHPPPEQIKPLTTLVTI